MSCPVFEKDEETLAWKSITAKEEKPQEAVFSISAPLVELLSSNGLRKLWQECKKLLSYMFQIARVKAPKKKTKRRLETKV